MSSFYAQGLPLVFPQDDLTIPQFMLDDIPSHPTRPSRPVGVPCLIDEETGKAVFLEELRNRAHTLARALYSRWNIAAGDVVSLYSPNHVDYIVVVWAVHRLGGIIATHGSALTHQELAYQLDIAKPVLLIAHEDNKHIAFRAANSINLSPNQLAILDGQLSSDSLCASIGKLMHEGATFPPYVEVKFRSRQAMDTIAFLCYSSGTTGNPKAVAISHYNVICNIAQVATSNRLNRADIPWEERTFRSGDVAAGILPFYHIYGLVYCLHYLLYSGITILVSKKFVYENLLRNIACYRISHVILVPPQAVLFCKHPATKNYDLSSVRYCVISAAPLSVELTDQLLNVFPGVHLGQGYSMTETCAVSTFLPYDKGRSIGSCGRLIAGTVAKVVKPNGALAGIGEPGELYVKGPQVSLGYYRNEEATRQTFIDGWIQTGDEVIFHKNGEFFVTDRIKELIKVKGNQVAPSELEGHLLTHTDVADAAVIGIADDYAGEVPLAFVVLKPQTASAVAKNDAVAVDVRKRLFQHVASAKTEYKWLKGGIEFIDAVPKNPSGKILRRLLRDRVKLTRNSERARL